MESILGKMLNSYKFIVVIIVTGQKYVINVLSIL
jgi:hypothetical protein